MNGATNYRDMTDAQMLEWGAAESAARIADLDGVSSPEALRTAQEKAETRRKAIGASRGQAADMVIRAIRQARNKV